MTVTDVITGSHLATFEARVVETFQTGAEPTGTEVDILGGEVTLDGTAKTRGTLEITVPGVDLDDVRLFPRGRNTLLNPLTGNEIFVRRGVDIGSEILWTPLGYYRIDEPEQENASDGPITLSCSDRMATIRDSRLLQPRAYDPGTTVGAVFDDLVKEIYPDAVITWDDNSDQASLGRQLVVERERYDALKNLADALGKLMYWDGNGELVLEDAPVEGEPVWEVNAGSDGVLVQPSRNLTREGIYNAVVAEGEAGDTDTPVRGVAADANPTSPTRFGGPFGRIPRFYSSQFLTTTTQAQTAAQALLRRHLGAPLTVSFSSVVNPELKPWDPIRVTYRNGDRDLHVMQEVTIPLTADEPMEGECREQAVIVLGGA